MIALLEPPVLDDELDPLSWLRKPPDSLTAAATQVGAKAKPNHGLFGGGDANSGSKSLAAFTLVVDAAPPTQKPAATTVSTAPPPPSAHPAAASRSSVVDQDNHACKSVAPVTKSMPQMLSTPNGTSSCKSLAGSALKAQQDLDNLNGFFLYDPLCDPFFPLESLLAAEARAATAGSPSAKSLLAGSRALAPFAAKASASGGSKYKIYNLLRDAIFRPPDWRWEKASYLLRYGLGFNRSRDDSVIGDLHRFQGFLQRCHTFEHYELLRAGTPNLFVAWKIWEQGDSPLRFELECRILAREPAASIGEKLGLTAAAVHWFGAAFFHVGDRLGRRSWVTNQVILPNGVCRTEREAIMLLCFAGGRYVCDDLFETLANQIPRSPEEVGAFYRDEARRTLATKAMLATRMISLDDPKNMIAVMKNWQRLKLAESRQHRNQLSQPDIVPNLKFMFDRIEATLGSVGPPASTRPIAGAGTKE